MPNFIKDAPWYLKDQKAEDPENVPDGKTGDPEDDNDDRILFHQRIGSNKD